MMTSNFKTLISASELQALMQAADVAVLDCRFDLANPSQGFDAYRTAHIPGARYADLDRDLSAPVTLRSGRHPLPDRETLASRFAALGVGAGRQTVVYDALNGSFAARAWWLLRWLGVSDVAVLDGGFAGWKAQGGKAHGAAVESGVIADAVHGGFSPGAQRGAWLTSEEVLATLADPARLLVDARAPERYSGRSEPLDPVAGHVPGAVNFPFSLNLHPDGRFLTPRELRERWLAQLGTVPAENAIMMCGSGVTACHNLLAMEHAGLTGAKLYAGSWSEWIKDPSRPTVRGDTPR